MNTVIEYRNVYKNYKEVKAVSNFSLTIEKGSFLTIIGSSGSGKTTLLKMINGLVKPDKGNIFINGKDINTLNLIELRRNIGYAIQGNILFPHLTVEENIAYVLNLICKDKTQIEKIVFEKLEMFSLSKDILKRYPIELSGGQQQRVGLARAFAAGSDILLMDEPFGAIDSIIRYQLQEELKVLHKKIGMTIVFITHDISEALKLGSHVLVLNEGEIQQFGTPDQIQNKPANEFVKKLVSMSGILRV